MDSYRPGVDSTHPLDSTADGPVALEDSSLSPGHSKYISYLPGPATSFDRGTFGSAAVRRSNPDHGESSASPTGSLEQSGRPQPRRPSGRGLRTLPQRGALPPHQCGRSSVPPGGSGIPADPAHLVEDIGNGRSRQFISPHRFETSFRGKREKPPPIFGGLVSAEGVF